MAGGQIYNAAFVTGSPAAPTGAEVVGNILVVTLPNSFTSWTSYPIVGGILSTYDSSGYVIISDSTTAGVIGRTTGNNTTNPINAPAGTEIADKPTFWVSNAKTSASFLDLVNKLPPSTAVGYNVSGTTPPGGRPFFDNGDPGTYNLPALPNFPYANAYDAARDWLKINGYWTSYP